VWVRDWEPLSDYDKGPGEGLGSGVGEGLEPLSDYDQARHLIVEQRRAHGI
jgi:hypothetical protein